MNKQDFLSNTEECITNMINFDWTVGPDLIKHIENLVERNKKEYTSNFLTSIKNKLQDIYFNNKEDIEDTKFYILKQDIDRMSRFEYLNNEDSKLKACRKILEELSKSLQKLNFKNVKTIQDVIGESLKELVKSCSLWSIGDYILFTTSKGESDIGYIYDVDNNKLTACTTNKYYHLNVKSDKITLLLPCDILKEVKK